MSPETDSVYHILVFVANLNPLTPELPQHGVPRQNILLWQFFS